MFGFCAETLTGSACKINQKLTWTLKGGAKVESDADNVHGQVTLPRKFFAEICEIRSPELKKRITRRYVSLVGGL